MPELILAYNLEQLDLSHFGWESIHRELAVINY